MQDIFNRRIKEINTIKKRVIKKSPKFFLNRIGIREKRIIDKRFGQIKSGDIFRINDRREDMRDNFELRFREREINIKKKIR